MIFQNELYTSETNDTTPHRTLTALEQLGRATNPSLRLVRLARIERYLIITTFLDELAGLSDPTNKPRPPLHGTDSAEEKKGWTLLKKMDAAMAAPGGLQ